jgi:hypothetical protein
VEKPQEVLATMADSDQNKRFEYRFVYREWAPFKKASLYLPAATLLMVFALYAYAYFFSPSIWERIFTDSSAILGFAMFFLMILLFSLILFFFSWSGVSFNQKGMTSRGCWTLFMPRHCVWSELSQIRALTLSAGEAAELVFTHISGKQYLLPISSRKKPLFIGDGHSLSVEEALTQFVGAIELLGDEEREKIPVIAAITKLRKAYSDKDLGKEVGHVAYIASGVAIFAFALMFWSGRPYLPSNLLGEIPYWVFGLVVGLSACWYMRRVKYKLYILLAALFLGSMVMLLLSCLFG